jgi:glutamine synthetase type III
MSNWKEIRVSDIMRNKNDLDLNKMYRAGAVNHNNSYKALEIESYEEFVKVLAQLEPGFEEYFVFEKEHYDEIPDLIFGEL